MWKFLCSVYCQGCCSSHSTLHGLSDLGHSQMYLHCFHHQGGILDPQRNTKLLFIPLTSSSLAPVSLHYAIVPLPVSNKFFSLRMYILYPIRLLGTQAHVSGMFLKPLGSRLEPWWVMWDLVFHLHGLTGILQG